LKQPLVEKQSPDVDSGSHRNRLQLAKKQEMSAVIHPSASENSDSPQRSSLVLKPQERKTAKKGLWDDNPEVGNLIIRPVSDKNRSNISNKLPATADGSSISSATHQFQNMITDIDWNSAIAVPPTPSNCLSDLVGSDDIECTQSATPEQNLIKQGKQEDTQSRDNISAKKKKSDKEQPTSLDRTHGKESQKIKKRMAKSARNVKERDKSEKNEQPGQQPPAASVVSGNGDTNNWQSHVPAGPASCRFSEKAAIVSQPQLLASQYPTPVGPSPPQSNPPSGNKLFIQPSKFQYPLDAPIQTYASTDTQVAPSTAGPDNSAPKQKHPTAVVLRLRDNDDDDNDDKEEEKEEDDDKDESYTSATEDDKDINELINKF
jgi:hypothetical protein